MKKLLIILVVLALSVGTVFAAGTVVGSKHDLRGTGGGTATNAALIEVCVSCHTPHQATAANKQDPLWNHTGTATTGFGVYSSVTMNASPANIGGSAMGSQSVSMLCMSCHDGTVSVISMYNPPNSGNSAAATTITGRINVSGFIVSNANIGTDMTDDHPVNFTYDAALVTSDGGLQPVASVSAYLIGGQVQCASCHDVHDPTNVPFLRLNNTGSALCLVCHIK
ncbi:MAG: cytochrome C [Nitrospirae bacterium]|nr:MAG: cytochrome C [Nitrospirota bacterium]